MALSIASLFQVEASSPSGELQLTMLFLAVAVSVTLISAGTLALQGSRESRWDAPLTVGIGALLLGIGTFQQVLEAAAAINDVENSSTGPSVWSLTAFRWSGLALVVGGLVWRSKTGWSIRVRVAVLTLVIAAPVVVAWTWATTGELNTSVERGVLMGLAIILVATSVRLARHDSAAPFFEGGTVLGSGLALAIIQQVASVEPGDIASIAGLAWLLVAGLLTALWFERQAALRSKTQRSQTERYIRLIEDTRHEIDQVLNDRSVLRHNSTSSLMAIEGGLDALGASIAEGDASSHQRMSRALASEIGRLRRMLSAANVGGTDPSTQLLDAVDAVVHLARSSGQLVVINVSESLVVAARGDAVAEILHSLLDNAATHSPGSVVVVEAVAGTEGLVELVVQDDGDGVRGDLHEKIFERGVSSRTGPNAGLGLFAARQLAEEAGGALDLIPTTDGACFRLVLPAAPAASVAPLRLLTDDQEIVL